MKKLMLLLCAGTLALSLTACSKNTLGPDTSAADAKVEKQVVVVKRNQPALKSQTVVVRRDPRPVVVVKR